MGKNRLEAFSDGVLAIIITIMVLEMKVPHGEAFSDLSSVVPVFLSYILSFVYVGIYWNNHHHLLHTVKRVSGPVLWANLHLLFWLSLFPFATGWMGENHFAPSPSALYGVVLLMAAFAYLLLQWAIIACDPENSLLKQILGSDWKGKTSVIFYIAGICTAMLWESWIAQALYVIVAFMWLIPDRRIERTFQNANN
ncbi:TMEM175 family protein [Quatrionicoccus australiensis]|uniref:TMEM175 family protein n=1 Tax=Quatrionicoccus australiensis TaxID=138118 RepID=UPI001CFA6EA4|nr:TMEM175 family protein [Quatrionicoccus australiensis]MCB4361507.1 DUF1211 domain-containing protein [Quatrionicoccus australiensis]